MDLNRVGVWAVTEKMAMQLNCDDFDTLIELRFASPELQPNKQ